MQSTNDKSTKAEAKSSTKKALRKKAEKILKRARRATKKIGEREKNSRVAIRLQLAKAAQIARRMEKESVLKTALLALAKERGLKQRTTSASPYLLLLRYLRLAPKGGSSTRHAQVVEALVNKNWNNKKTRQRLLTYGPTHFLKKKGGAS